MFGIFTPAVAATQFTNEPHHGNPSAFINLPYFVRFSFSSIVPISATADTNTRLGIGTTGQVLTVAAGVPSWAAASSGAMTLIQRSSFSNVANTGTTFDGVFSSTYGSYYLVFESMYAAAGADDLHLQWRYAGPTTQAATYFGNDIAVESGTTTITNNAQSNTSQSVLTRYIGPSSDPGKGQFFIYGASGTSSQPAIYGNYHEGGRGATTTPSVINLDIRTYTGFILKSSSSNITGTVSLYGLVKA